MVTSSTLWTHLRDVTVLSWTALCHHPLCTGWGVNKRHWIPEASSQTRAGLRRNPLRPAALEIDQNASRLRPCFVGRGWGLHQSSGRARRKGSWELVGASEEPAVLKVLFTTLTLPVQDQDARRFPDAPASRCSARSAWFPPRCTRCSPWPRSRCLSSHAYKHPHRLLGVAPATGGPLVYLISLTTARDAPADQRFDSRIRQRRCRSSTSGFAE